MNFNLKLQYFSRNQVVKNIKKQTVLLEAKEVKKTEVLMQQAHIRRFTNEKVTGAKMCLAVVSGIVTAWGSAGQLLVDYLSPSQRALEVVAKVTYTQFSW